MALHNVTGQNRAKRFLKQLIATGQLPHALLFSGMAGIGKSAMAREFAKAVNCLQRDHGDCCDQCSACRKMTTGQHPDLLWVRSEGTTIKIDQIRELRKRLRFSPFEGPWRLVVIEDAQNLREEAGNALLKLLEEPPGQNIFLLLALEPQMLLPTIVSRCCQVRFQPLDSAWIEAQLVKTHGIAPELAHAVARIAEGSLDRALWLVEDQNLQRWQDILQNISGLGDLTMIDFFALMGRWVKESKDLEQDFQWIKLWMRECILTRLNREHQPVLQPDAGRSSTVRDVSIDALFQLYEHIEQAEQLLRQNANKQLTLESVCLALKDSLYGESGRNSVSQRR